MNPALAVTTGTKFTWSSSGFDQSLLYLLQCHPGALKIKRLGSCMEKQGVGAKKTGSLGRNVGGDNCE